MTTHSSILARKLPWRATVHGVTKSQTRLSMNTHTHTHEHMLHIDSWIIHMSEINCCFSEVIP